METFPSTIPISMVGDVRNNVLTLKSRSESQKLFTRRTGGQFWSFTIKMPPLKADEFAAFEAFTLRQNGGAEPFQIVLPHRKLARGVATGTPLVNGGAKAGATVVYVDGFTPGITSIMMEGDIIKFGSHSKVYTNLYNVTSAADEALQTETGEDLITEASEVILLESSNQAMLTIWPPLVQDVPDNDTVTVNGVPFTVVMTTPIYSISAPNIYATELDMEEDF
ncbi:MAG: hypothetical protein OEY64_03315 [Nitrospinota bacterium]|nr:hypothetical protein [Nitrospinota bacterium]